MAKYYREKDVENLILNLAAESGKLETVETSEDCIGRTNAIEVVGHFLNDLKVELFGLSGEALAKRFLDNCPNVVPANPCEECQHYDIGFVDGQIEILQKLTDALEGKDEE